MTKQTWLNLRAEYVEELSFQFNLREQIEKKPDKKMEEKVATSAKRCRAYDYLIQSHANTFKDQIT